MIYEFKGYKPVVHESSFVPPLANVCGNVSIGKNVFIGSGAALRGDIGEIVIEDGCNVQENCVIHMFPGETVHLKEGTHVGHGAIVHGATVGKNVLIGMHSVVMDHADIGDNCIIGAMTLVTEGMKVPERKVLVGNPARIIKDVTDEMLEWKTRGTAIYQSLPAEYFETMKECEPLRKTEERKKQEGNYLTWKNTQKKN